MGAGFGSVLTRGRGLTSERSITLLDLGIGAATGNFGGDMITGDGATDVVLGERGNDGIHGNGADDYLEGGQDTDTIDGDAGQDDIVGGEFTPSSGAGATTVGQLDAGDIIRGGTEGDVVLGDNGALLRAQAGVTTSDLTKNRGITERAVQLYDLGDTPTASTSGNDFVHGNEGADVILGQSGTDRLLAGRRQRLRRGRTGRGLGRGRRRLRRPGRRLVVDQVGQPGRRAQGQPDAADVVWGQGGDDVATGDNALVTRVAPFNDLPPSGRSASGQIEERRAAAARPVQRRAPQLPAQLDPLRRRPAVRAGRGRRLARAGRRPTPISGGSDDDYAEGQGAGETDLRRPVRWPTPGSPVPAGDVAGLGVQRGFDADGRPDGQDDLIGG